MQTGIGSLLGKLVHQMINLQALDPIREKYAAELDRENFRMTMREVDALSTGI